jgi:crotonobetainyl-CoA:carnitine CoA-transferase CaiB-like acyl-CoA transferase
MMSVTGMDADHPVRTGTPIGDLGAGLFATTGILAALHERQSSGEGQHVDISMLDCQVSLLNYLVSMYGFTGIDPQPMGNAHSVHVPYNTYQASDGHIVIAVLTDQHWLRFRDAMECEALNHPDFETQPGRNANRVLIEQEINAITAARPAGFWLEKLKASRVPCSPVNLLSQALSDRQVLHRNMFIDLKHPGGDSRKGPGHPIKMSRTSEETFSPAPLIGQDTGEVLSGLLGYDSLKIEELRNKGVIG